MTLNAGSLKSLRMAALLTLASTPAPTKRE